MRVEGKQEYKKDRPIPYILDLQQDGLLIIGWDRKMMTPANYSAIEPTKVAVEEDYTKDDARFWE